VSLTALFLLFAGQVPLSPDPRPIPITGIVVERSNAGPSRPVAGADVWLVEAFAADQCRRSGMELWWTNLTPPGEGMPTMVVQGRSDLDGRFTIHIPAEAVARRSPPQLAIWAAVTGPHSRIAVRPLPRIVLADDPPVRLELGSPVRAEFTVRGSDQNPVAAAKLIPTRVSEFVVPEALGRSLAGTTDADGRITIAGFSRASLEEVRIDAPGFGTQIVRMPEPPARGLAGRTEAAESIALTLAPVGCVSGRLIAPGNEPLKGVTVHATTQSGGYLSSGIAGKADVPCDAEGRFSISAIAEGTITLALEFDSEHSTSLRGDPPKRLVVTKGQSVELTIPLRETLLVQGVVRERGTNRPIAGVKVALNGQYGGDRFAVTGAEGKFAGRIMRDLNQPFGWPVRIPTPYFYPTDQAETPQGMPRHGSAVLELPPVVLPRGVDVKAIVVGEKNQGVAGCSVEAIWTTADGMAQAALARADQTGSVTLHGIDPLAELNVTAWDRYASTSRPVTVRPEANPGKPVALTISPRNSASIGGRVIDLAGRGIARASIRIRRQVQDRNGRAIVIDPVVNEDGSSLLKSDAEGRYRTPERVPLDGVYYAEAVAPECLSARSPQVVLAGHSQELPDLVLRRVGVIVGQVVDRQGQSVAGALIRQSGDGPLPTRTLSDEQGSFRLPGVLEGPALVFAEKAGYRFHFQRCEDRVTAVRLQMSQIGESSAVSYRTLPSVLPTDDEKAMARKLIQAHGKFVMERGNDEDKFRYLIEAAAVDPSAVLEQVQTVKFSDPDYLHAVNANLTEVVARDSLDDALALIEAFPSADNRARAFVGICDLRRDLDPARVQDLLAQATLNAHNMKSSARRLAMYATIADHWLDLGKTDRARSLVEQALALGKNEVKGAKGLGFELGYVGEVLARIDPPAGLKVLDDLAREVKSSDKRDRSYVFHRFHGRIAYKLAAQSPADAEMVLDRIPIGAEGDRSLVSVCTKMAPKDLARARKIADTRISPDAAGYRPYALGLMAQAIAASDRAAALGLIVQAYSSLEELALIGRSARPVFVEVAGALLPVVEQVAPERLPEFLGRTLALRPLRGDQTETIESGVASTTAALAMLVARYDRAAAAHLLEPELKKAGTYQGLFGNDYVTWRVLAAESVIDPRRAVALVDALPDDPGTGTDPTATKNMARMHVARLLALHGADRWQYVYENFLYLWTPDQRNL
jgi:hypothetical protein